jgi:hypothetical protein
MKNKHCYKFNENSLTFSQILKEVTKDDGTLYSQPSSINGIYCHALKKIFKNYLKYFDLHYTDAEVGKMVATYEVQQLIYSILADGCINTPNYTLTKENLIKNEKK